MKNWLIPVIVIVVLGIIIYSLTVGFNNTAIEKQEDARLAWSNVESSYQRRNDLITNLVRTVQGAADFERGTLTDVIEARSRATQVTIDPTNITPEQMAQFQQAQGEVSGALSRLLVTVERYPELRATQNFQQLQSQLEGTENRINVARDRYNESVRDFNTYIRKFPNSLFAGMFGFDQMTNFEADAGSEDAPDVEFDFQ
ncbi:MAG TPA: LemA family protein [Gillisia sp.]|nr:LemA family protein [Gillisia sp.]